MQQSMLPPPPPPCAYPGVRMECKCRRRCQLVRHLLRPRSWRAGVGCIALWQLVDRPIVFARRCDFGKQFVLLNWFGSSGPAARRQQSRRRFLAARRHRRTRSRFRLHSDRMPDNDFFCVDECHSANLYLFWSLRRWWSSCVICFALFTPVIGPIFWLSMRRYGGELGGGSAFYRKANLSLSFPL